MLATLNRWTDFDGWCLQYGIDPLEMPSRRYFSAAWRWMTEGLDEKQLAELHQNLDKSVTEVETHIRHAETKKAVKAAKEENKGFVPAPKWRAPEGWTPPGWDEAAASQTGLSFMGKQGSLKQGGKA